MSVHALIAIYMPTFRSSVAFTFRPPGNRVQTAQTSRDDTENAGETAPRVAQRLNDVRSMGGIRAINRVRALSQFSASDGGHTQPEILRQIRGIVSRSSAEPVFDFY